MFTASCTATYALAKGGLVRDPILGTSCFWAPQGAVRHQRERATFLSIPNDGCMV